MENLEKKSLTQKLKQNSKNIIYSLALLIISFISVYAFNEIRTITGPEAVKGDKITADWVNAVNTKLNQSAGASGGGDWQCFFTAGVYSCVNPTCGDTCILSISYNTGNPDAPPIGNFIWKCVSQASNDMGMGNIKGGNYSSPTCVQ